MNNIVINIICNECETFLQDKFKNFMIYQLEQISGPIFNFIKYNRPNDIIVYLENHEDFDIKDIATFTTAATHDITYDVSYAIQIKRIILYKLLAAIYNDNYALKIKIHEYLHSKGLTNLKGGSCTFNHIEIYKFQDIDHEIADEIHKIITDYYIEIKNKYTF